MEDILEIMKRIMPNTDFDTIIDLVDDGIIDSLDIVTIVSEFEEHFSITIEPDDIDPDNFRSLDTMNKLVNKYK